MGAAAITGGTRISSATLTNEVASLNAAYQTDKVKGVSPQLPVGHETQQVLSWLVRFRIADKIAEQHRINVTAPQVDRQYTRISNAARQNKLTVPEYVSAGGALPPDLVPQFARYSAILTALAAQLTGGKTPSSQAEQNNLAAAFAHDQCVASKSLGISVNPQFGDFDYNSYSVVPAPPTLAANPGPSKPAAVRLTPPC
jgi:hypothetical protein